MSFNLRKSIIEKNGGKNVLIYDVEILTPISDKEQLGRPSELEFGSAVMYDYSADRYSFYDQTSKDLLVGLLANNTVVSFNGIQFDNIIVGKTDWKDIDLFQKVVESKFEKPFEDVMKEVEPEKVFNGTLGLDVLCKNNLEVGGKSGPPENVPLLFESGLLSEVYEYNLNDVRLTRKLFEIVVLAGKLKDGDGRVLDIDLGLEDTPGIPDSLLSEIRDALEEPASIVVCPPGVSLEYSQPSKGACGVLFV